MRKIPKWDTRNLPFLEENLEFRKKHTGDLSRNSIIFCAYGGEGARLTKYYASRFRIVYALDKEFPHLPRNVIAFEMKDSDFLAIMKDLNLPEKIDVLDIDPYGSPTFFLSEFLSRYRGVVGRIILTDGALTIAKVRRKINLYKYYGLRPNKTIVTKRWHYDHYPCILFSAVKDIVQREGYFISFFDYEFNRYKTAIYACFILERDNENVS